MSEPLPRPRPPWTVRTAGVLVSLEGLVALAASAVFLIRAVSGSGNAGSLGYGAAAGFAGLGLVVGGGGVALALGQRWGRALAVVTQLLLVPFAYGLVTDSDQRGYGAGIGILVVVTLGLVFCAPSASWLADEFDEGRSGSDDEE